jgi:hypothetical protein
MKNLFSANSIKRFFQRCSVVLFCMYFMAPLYAQPSSGMVQNAVLEGIQFSSEPGKEPDEKVITCYFIFRDKPSSYFYEIRKKTKKLVFEFNDTQKGTSPVASQKETPIEGFEVEQKKIDVNKEVRGLNQEWHDLISVSFDLSMLPQVHVSDEYNVISFSYKWTTDPLKIKNYVVREDDTKTKVIWGSVGAFALGSAAFLYYRFGISHQGPPPGDIPTNDLPSHVLQSPY